MPRCGETSDNKWQILELVRVHEHTINTAGTNNAPWCFDVRLLRDVLSAMLCQLLLLWASLASRCLLHPPLPPPSSSSTLPFLHTYFVFFGFIVTVFFFGCLVFTFLFPCLRLPLLFSFLDAHLFLCFVICCFFFFFLVITHYFFFCTFSLCSLSSFTCVALIYLLLSRCPI